MRVKKIGTQKWSDQNWSAEKRNPKYWVIKGRSDAAVHSRCADNRLCHEG